MEELNLDVDYFTHPKTLRLIGVLGRGAEVYPIKLWCWCAKYHAEDGLLAGYSDEEVESVIGWTGDRGAFVAALVKFGLAERREAGLFVHDFYARNGHIAAFKARAKQAAEKRWSKLRAQVPAVSTPETPGNAQAMLEQCPGTPQAVPKQAPSMAKTMLEQSPTYLPTYLPTRKEEDTRRKEPAHSAAAKDNNATGKEPEIMQGPPDPLLDQYLLQQWGRDGRLAGAVMSTMLGLGRRHGQERLRYAIAEAARHNKKSLAYVQAVLGEGKKNGNSIPGFKEMVEAAEAKTAPREAVNG